MMPRKAIKRVLQLARGAARFARRLGKRGKFGTLRLRRATKKEYATPRRAMRAILQSLRRKKKSS